MPDQLRADSRHRRGHGRCGCQRERLCPGLGRHHAAQPAVRRRHALFGIRSPGEARIQIQAAMGHRQGAHARHSAGRQDRHRLCAQRDGVEKGPCAASRHLPRSEIVTGDERAPPRRALEGVRVLALETSLSGPHATKILADMGAEIIKIEKPGTGDVIRGWDTAVKGLSSGYVWVNGNKKSGTLDMEKPAALEILTRLAARVDVVLENFAPGAAERVGLGANDPTRPNPRPIYCSLSGYGQNGPYRDMKAYDVLIQGEAGIIATTGYPDAPAKVGFSMIDLTSAMYAAVGILLALYQREKTGQGQVIDISMFETAVSWLGYFPHHYWHRGEEPARLGMRHQYITPYGPYLAGDH